MLVRRCRGCHDHYGCTEYKVRKGQITAVGLAASALIEAFIEFRVIQQVLLRRADLVTRPLKVVRESTSGKVRRHLWAKVVSAANASDKGACKSWKSGERLVLALV